MKTGTMMALRSRAEGPGLAIVLAFLLPVLLGVLPPLTPTAAFALERDIAASRCLEPGEGGPAAPHHAHDQCCILCPAAQVAGAVAADVPSLPVRREAAQAADFADGVVVAFHPAVAGLSARGPPAI